MTVKTLTKGITFEQAMKLFTKFVTKKAPSPVLEYVYYNGTHLVATDSMQLLRINANHITDFPVDKETFFYDPKNMQFVECEGNFPSTERLIPNYSDSTIMLNDNIKDLYNTVKEARKHVKGVSHNLIKLEFTQSNTTISGKNEVEKEDTSGVPAKVEIEYSKTLENVSIEGQSLIVHCNAAYLENIITVAKKMTKVSHEPTLIKMNGHLRPIHIEKHGVFDALILPIRTTH